MDSSPYQPLFYLTRGAANHEIVESIHYGAFAIVDVHGRLVAHFGDSRAVTFLRSSAKPFQAMPFLESGGQAAFNLREREIAILCASHSGTDEHAALVKAIQSKIGVSEADLLCGVHPPIDPTTAEDLIKRGEAPTPLRHNCSGKHTGMLAFARLKGLPIQDYINPQHPIQQWILQAFAEMCDLAVENIVLGTDGCSAPNFAVPLYHAALAWARLCDPVEGEAGSSERAEACNTITRAMTSNPDMVAGPERFDTRLMEASSGRIVAKGGAEGYQCLGLLPGALGRGSAALGIAIKISDGDPKSRARPAVALEILRRLGALSAGEMEKLAAFGPQIPVYNWRKLLVGYGKPCFEI